MAYAGAEFTAKLLRALKGEKGVVAPTFVNLAADPSGGETLKKELGKDVEYFSANVELGVRLDLSSQFCEWITDDVWLTAGRGLRDPPSGQDLGLREGSHQQGHRRARRQHREGRLVHLSVQALDVSMLKLTISSSL